MVRSNEHSLRRSVMAHGSRDWKSVSEIVGISFENLREENPNSFKMRFFVSDSGDKRQW